MPQCGFHCSRSMNESLKKRRGRGWQASVRVLYLPLVVVWVDVAIAIQHGFYRGPAVIARVMIAMEAQWQWDLPRLAGGSTR